MSLPLIRLVRGHYRVHGEDHFAHISKDGRHWLVTIRASETGNLLRYAGLWPTLKDAREEAERVLQQGGL